MLTSKDIVLTRRIEDWAYRQVILHKRECQDSGCSGRSKIWWITRHPASHPDVANRAAIDYVLSRQCCDILEARLVDRPSGRSSARVGPGFSQPLDEGSEKIFWLPGEKKLNRSRSVEEKAQLLGRVFFPSVTSESPEVLPRKSIIPEVQKSARNSSGKVPARKNPPAHVPSDYGSVVDALTRKG